MKAKIICILIFIMLMTVSLSVSGNNNKLPEQLLGSAVVATDKKIINPFSTNVLVRINVTEGYASIPRGAEALGSKPGEWIDVIIPQSKLYEITKTQNDYSVLIWDIDGYSQSFAGQYHTLAEMEQTLQNIASSYPNITSLYSIGTTYEGRDIWCLEISDNPGVDEEEPGVFYMGLHHAREWPTLEICLHIANMLTSEYKSNPDITDVVNNRRLWLVPCVNPDGYYYCHDQGHDWRKNRHYFTDFGTYGVDLNRNYGGSCNGDTWGSWGSLGPASVTHKAASSVYCGPLPLSEFETQAIRNVFLENDICATISWHTYGELVMWPWSYSSNSVTPDDTYMAQVGNQIASHITKMSGSGIYTPQQSSYLYPTTGDTTDWAYGYGHYVLGRSTFAYTIEACSSFHPSDSSLDQVCNENFDGALYLLQEAENIKNNVIPRVLPPVIDEMYGGPEGNFTISWHEQNPDAKSDYFQLDEMANLSIVTEDAESGSDLWNLDGFSITNSKYHLSNNCFKSREKNSDVSSMTSVYPVPIKKGMMLSFWCWYNTESNYDMAFVEVSKDGRCYQLLDKFTGSSEDWVYTSYDLDEYAGESIFIRFRYSTDANIVGDGFYVDDIVPIADFNSIVTLSNSTDNRFYEITDRADGDYYYRVRGYNSKHGWGDFSNLEKMHVGFVENEAPYAPTINGVTSGKTGESYGYIVSAHDPDDDSIYLYIEWGNDNFSEWIGPYGSDEEITSNHTFFEKGVYTIRAKAMDTYGVESGWRTLEVRMPKNWIVNSPFIKFLETHSYLFPILQRLFEI